MKTNQTDEDTDKIETTQLAAFGFLVGGVVTAFLFLALILSSIPGPTKAPASEVRTQIEDAVAPQPIMATTGPERQVGIVDTQARTSPRISKPRKRKVLSPSPLRTSGHSRDYRTAVAPGKTPKMIQVQ